MPQLVGYTPRFCSDGRSPDGPIVFDRLSRSTALELGYDTGRIFLVGVPEFHKLVPQTAEYLSTTRLVPECRAPSDFSQATSEQKETAKSDSAWSLSIV